MRTSAAVLGLSAVLIGGGAIGAHAQTNDSSSSSDASGSSGSSSSNDNSGTNTMPQQGDSGAPQDGNCPGM
jgi:hypothetical protein